MHVKWTRNTVQRNYFHETFVPHCSTYERHIDCPMENFAKQERPFDVAYMPFVGVSVTSLFELRHVWP